MAARKLVPAGEARKLRGTVLDRAGGMTTPLHPPGPALSAVLLDVDGTLIDSNDAHARAWVAAFAAHGYVVPFDAVRALIGKGGDKLLPELTGLDPESAEGQAVSDDRTRIFRERELSRLRPTRGARALLETLRGAGLGLVVATSARAEEVQALLEQAGVADLVDAASSSDDADRSKPDPDIVRAALRRGRYHAAQTVMLGDTPYDVEAALRARVPLIALRSGGWWSDEALAGAAAIYDDPEALRQQLDDSPLRPALHRTL